MELGLELAGRPVFHHSCVFLLHHWFLKISDGGPEQLLHSSFRRARRAQAFFGRAFPKDRTPGGLPSAPFSLLQPLLSGPQPYFSFPL